MTAKLNTTIFVWSPQIGYCYFICVDNGRRCPSERVAAKGKIKTSTGDKPTKGNQGFRLAFFEYRDDAISSDADAHGLVQPCGKDGNLISPLLTAHESRRRLYLVIGYLSDALMKRGITMKKNIQFRFEDVPPLYRRRSPLIEDDFPPVLRTFLPSRIPSLFNLSPVLTSIPIFRTIPRRYTDEGTDKIRTTN